MNDIASRVIRINEHLAVMALMPVKGVISRDYLFMATYQTAGSNYAQVP